MLSLVSVSETCGRLISSQPSYDCQREQLSGELKGCVGVGDEPSLKRTVIPKELGRQGLSPPM